MERMIPAIPGRVNVIFNAFNARTHRLNIFSNLSKNKIFMIIIAFIVIIQIIMIYIILILLS